MLVSIKPLNGAFASASCFLFRPDNIFNFNDLLLVIQLVVVVAFQVYISNKAVEPKYDDPLDLTLNSKIMNAVKLN